MLHVGEPSLLPRPKEPSSGRTDKRSSSQNPWRPTCMHGGGYKIQYVQTSMGQFLPSSSFHFFLPLFQIITTSFSSPPFFLRPAFLLSFIFSSLSPTPNFPPSPLNLYTPYFNFYILPFSILPPFVPSSYLSLLFFSIIPPSSFNLFLLFSPSSLLPLLFISPSPYHLPSSHVPFYSFPPYFFFFPCRPPSVFSSSQTRGSAKALTVLPEKRRLSRAGRRREREIPRSSTSPFSAKQSTGGRRRRGKVIM